MKVPAKVDKETFQNPLDERVLEHVAFVEGGMLKKLGLAYS